MKKLFVIITGMVLALNLIGCTSTNEKTETEIDIQRGPLIEHTLTEEILTEEILTEETLVEYVDNEYLAELGFNSQTNSFGK